MVGSPQRISSEHRQPATAGTFHHLSTQALGQQIWNNFVSLLHFTSLPYPTSTLGIQQWGCLNVQILFVHSVTNHFCSVASQPWQVEIKKKKRYRAFCFLCSVSEVSSIQQWGYWVFSRICFGGFSGLCWGDSYFTVRLQRHQVVQRGPEQHQWAVDGSFPVRGRC